MGRGEDVFDVWSNTTPPRGEGESAAGRLLALLAANLIAGVVVWRGRNGRRRQESAGMVKEESGVQVMMPTICAAP